MAGGARCVDAQGPHDDEQLLRTLDRTVGKGTHHFLVAGDAITLV